MASKILTKWKCCTGPQSGNLISTQYSLFFIFIKYEIQQSVLIFHVVYDLRLHHEVTVRP